METAYVQAYTNLWLNCLTPEFHKRTCGYWYTIQSEGYAHTAFATKEELLQWLKERNLHLTAELPEERGTYKRVEIKGKYAHALHWDVENYDAIIPQFEIKTWDNGEIVTAKVTKGREIRIVHVLNVNQRKAKA